MKRIIGVLLLLAVITGIYAAVGCDLNDPDRDVKRLFPTSTGYKTYYVSIQQKGGTALLNKVQTELGDKFTGMYETIDVPYTVYEITKGKQIIGYIHGVNQKGEYGGIQIFLALDTKGTILGMYFQRMTNTNAKSFRSPAFYKQFIGLDLADFAGYNPATGKQTGKIAAIKNPAPKAQKDFLSTLRGVKKNLILMQDFGFTKA